LKASTSSAAAQGMGRSRQPSSSPANPGIPRGNPPRSRASSQGASRLRDGSRRAITMPGGRRQDGQPGPRTGSGWPSRIAGRHPDHLGHGLGASSTTTPGGRRTAVPPEEQRVAGERSRIIDLRPELPILQVRAPQEDEAAGPVEPLPDRSGSGPGRSQPSSVWGAEASACRSSGADAGIDPVRTMQPRQRLAISLAVFRLPYTARPTPAQGARSRSCASPRFLRQRRPSTSSMRDPTPAPFRADSQEAKAVRRFPGEEFPWRRREAAEGHSISIGHASASPPAPVLRALLAQTLAFILLLAFVRVGLRFPVMIWCCCRPCWRYSCREHALSPAGSSCRRPCLPGTSPLARAHSCLGLTWRCSWDWPWCSGRLLSRVPLYHASAYLGETGGLLQTARHAFRGPGLRLRRPGGAPPGARPDGCSWRGSLAITWLVAWLRCLPHKMPTSAWAASGVRTSRTSTWPTPSFALPCPPLGQGHAR